MKVTIERKPTEAERIAIDRAEQILSEAKLTLIGTRPKDR
jgi:hypothetical protein